MTHTTTATVTIPCPHCPRRPQVEVPVEWKINGLEWVGHFDGNLLRLAVAAHRKQHE